MNTKQRKPQNGFTLIELVIVIVVIGVLSAIALPRFINTSTDARVASVNGVAGGLRSAVALVQAGYVSAGSTTSTSVTMLTGTTVAVAAGSGLPAATAAGIGSAMQDTSAYNVTYAGGTATFQAVSGGSATCQAVYTAATGVVTTTTSGC